MVTNVDTYWVGSQTFHYYNDYTSTGSVTVQEWQESMWNHWTTNGTNSGVRLRAARIEDARRRMDDAEEERAARRELRMRLEQEDRERIEAHRARAREATVRARQLLLMVLTEEERTKYEADRNNSIEITGSDGKRYVVRTNSHEGNVYLLDRNGNEVLGYCCHPYMWDPRGNRIPREDAFVAQILALKTDAPGFIETANVSWRGRGYLAA